MNAEGIRNTIITEVNKLGHLGYDWDGNGGYPLRPDAHRLVHVACSNSMLVAEYCHTVVGLTKEGGITVCHHTKRPDARALTLTFVDGTTILWRKQYPSGAYSTGKIRDATCADVASDVILADLARWIHEKD